MQVSRESHKRQPDFIPWYREVDVSLIHVGSLTKTITPHQVTKTQVLTKRLVLHLRNGESQTVYTKLS
jgi:hypothetical protein